MIRIENSLDTELNDFPIDNVQKICRTKFGLSGQMLELAGNCLMTGHYHKHCKKCLLAYLIFTKPWLKSGMAEAVLAVLLPTAL